MNRLTPANTSQTRYCIVNPVHYVFGRAFRIKYINSELYKANTHTNDVQGEHKYIFPGVLPTEAEATETTNRTQLQHNSTHRRRRRRLFIEYKKFANRKHNCRIEIIDFSKCHI